MFIEMKSDRWGIMNNNKKGSYERLVKVFVFWKILKDIKQRMTRSDSCFNALQRISGLQCGEWTGWPDQRARRHLGSYYSSSCERWW